MNKTKRNIILASLLIPALGLLIPAYAVSTISGTVTSGGIGLNNAKVTIEQDGGFLIAPEYYTQRTSSTGAYSISVNDAGTSYNVAAMLDGKEYKNQAFTAPTSSANLAINSRSTVNGVVWVVADDGFKNDHPSWQTDAKNIAWAFSEAWFREEHSIILKDTTAAGYGSYVSPNSGMDCPTWAQNAATAMSWSSSNNRGAKVMIVIAGKDVSFTDGSLGCITPNPPVSQNSYPIVVVKDGYGDPAKLSMHEISHAYGLIHNSDINYDVMKASVNDQYSIKNWNPGNDNTVELHRTWLN